MAPELEPKVMQAVEALGYRATVGDVAAQSGLRIADTERGLLALASEVGGHLQVAETGDIAYAFPRNFRSILFNKYWQLRFQQGFAKLWNVVFYLIRIGFGLALIASIGILAIALLIAAFAAMAASSNDDNDNGSSSNLDGLFRGLGDLLGGSLRLFYYADWIGWGNNDSGARSARPKSKRAPSKRAPSELNFLEAVFSFLFGDGNPNADLEDRRWQAIGQVIRQQGGAIAAEQVLPFLDASGAEADDAILPVLLRFQGQPQVSPSGDLVYQFPELQVSAAPTRSQTALNSSAFLQEHPWRFSKATSGQLWAAGLLGLVNAGLAVAVGLMLPDLSATGMGFLVFVGQIYPLLLVYGLGFLAIPLVRWQVLKWRDRGVNHRNQQRQVLGQALAAPTTALRTKLAYAQQFVTQNQLKPENAAYTTESDLIEQEIEHQDQLDAEWQRRLSS